MIGCGMAHGQDLQAAAAMLPVARSDGREVEGAFALPPQLWLSAEACSAAVAACERRGWDVTSTDPVDGAPAVQRTLARRPLLGAGGVVERSGRAPRPLEVVQDDDGAWALAREALELARPRVAAYYSVPAESIELLWAYVKIYDATSGRRGLGEHSDASDVTLNVMLSCEDEGCDGFGGGTRLYLFDAAESATLAVRRAAFRAAHGRGGDWGAELARSLGEKDHVTQSTAAVWHAAQQLAVDVALILTICPSPAFQLSRCTEQLHAPERTTTCDKSMCTH